MMDNKEIYDARYHDDIPYKYKTNTRYQRYLITKAERYIDASAIRSICDVGCGQGLNTVLFCDDYPNAEILGIDLSDTGVLYANEKYGDIDNLKFVQGDIQNCGNNRKYSMVCALEVLEHIEDWRSVAGKIAEMSERYVLISSPIGRMREYEKRHGHYRNFQKGELEAFFNGRGFRTVKAYYAGFPFWSPLTRDLLNLMPGDSIDAQKSMRGGGKILSLFLYYSFRYFSSVHIGDQFMGLFEKV